jgi:hypothetical protein
MSALYAIATKVIAYALPFASVAVGSASYAAFRPLEVPVSIAEPKDIVAHVAPAAPVLMPAESPIVIEPMKLVLRKEVEPKNWVCIRQELLVGRLATVVRSSAAPGNVVWACDWR